MNRPDEEETFPADEMPERPHLLLQPIPYHGDPEDPEDEDSMILTVEQAELLTAGAEWVIDTWFDSLGSADMTDEEFHKGFRHTFMANDLPPRYLPLLDGSEVKRLLITAIDYIGRVHRTGYAAPRSTAESIVLNAIISNAVVLAESHNETPDREGPEEPTDFGAFEHHVFQDYDHKMMWSRQLDGIENDEEFLAHQGIGKELQLDHWFDPYWPHIPVHPYVIGE